MEQKGVTWAKKKNLPQAQSKWLRRERRFRRVCTFPFLDDD